METKLYEASLTGDIQALNALLHQDQLILDRLSLTGFNESPLHIAAMCGHHQFATVLLTQKPKLAIALDSHRRTPLHLASANGYLETVQELVRAGGRDVCCFQDQDGLTSLHLTAMNERLEVVKALVQANPVAAKKIAESGETILHMCVSYNSMESLKVLMQVWSEEELAKITDNGGNTLLHAAAINKHTQILNYLLRIPSIKANGNAVNGLGLTALDILDQCPRDLKLLETREILMEAGVLRANDLRPALDRPLQSLMKSSQNKRKGLLSRTWAWYVNADHHRIEKQRGTLIVAALVVTGMSFYSGIYPPGGTFSSSQNGIYPLGNAVQTEVDMEKFDMFVANNTVTMITSLVVVLVLSGFPLKNKFWMWVLTLGTMSTMVSMVTTYLESLSMITPDGYFGQATYFICVIGMVGCGVVALIHTIFFHSLGGDEAFKVHNAKERQKWEPGCG